MKMHVQNEKGDFLQYFADGTTKEVHDSWISERMIQDRTYKFKCMRFAEEQTNLLKEMIQNKLAKETHLCSELIEMHLRYEYIQTILDYKIR